MSARVSHDVEMLAGASTERGNDRRPLLFGLFPLALREYLALSGVSNPTSPLIHADLGLLQVRQRVGGLGPSRLELDPVVLVGRVLRAEPLLQHLDLAL